MAWDKLTATTTFLLHPTPETDDIDIRIFKDILHICRVSKELFIFGEAFQITFKTIKLLFDDLVKAEKAFRALTADISLGRKSLGETCIHYSFQTAPPKTWQN